MTRTELLLTILAEECVEVAQRCTKALRFGLTEVQPGQVLNNAERIMGELADLLGVAAMLQAEDALPDADSELVDAKEAKVEKYLKYSKECGVLDS